MKKVPVRHKKRTSGKLRLLLGFLFLLAGFLYIVQLAGINIGFRVDPMATILSWVAAVGSFVGGFHMVFGPRRPHLVRL